MKKRDLILIFTVFLFAGAVWIGALLFYSGKGGTLRISVDGYEYGVYDLTLNQEIRIEDTNICQIENGLVSMTYGDCPDKICVHSLPISKNGQTIICMPNRIMLEVTKSDPGQIDTMVE